MLLGITSKGVHNGLKLPHRLGIIQHMCAQSHPVDRTVDHHPRKSRLDRCNGSPTLGIKCVNSRVGIVDRNTLLAKQIRCCRLTHADGSCQPKDDHVVASTSL